MSIANEVFKSTSKARKSYYDNKKEWDEIFEKCRQGDYIIIPLSMVYHLIPNEYRYYSYGYLSFFHELGFGVELPSPVCWISYGCEIIKLIQ